MNKIQVAIIFLLTFVNVSEPLFSKAITTRTLPNGLKMVIEEDHTYPVVGITALVKVGRSNEGPGEMQLTHMLEHCVFGTTKHRQRPEAYRALYKKGAIFGGATGFNYTILRASVDRAYLGPALDVIYEMLFESQLTDEDILFAKKTISDETRMRQYDEGKAFYETQLLAYPGHSYFDSDFVKTFSINPEQLRRFYTTYYVPNNSVIAVVGDVKSEAVFPLLEKVFRHARPSPHLPPDPPAPNARASFNNVVRRWPVQNKAYTNIFFATPGLFHPDRAALEVLSQILNASNGPVKKAALESKLARSSTGTLWSDKEVGGLMIENMPTDMSQGPKLAAAVVEAIANFSRLTIGADEIAAAKRSLGVDRAFVGEDRRARSVELAKAAAFGGTRYYAEFLQRINKVTAEDVRRVIQRYLTKENLTVLNVLPESAGPVPKTDLDLIEKATQPLPDRKPGQAGVDYRARLYSSAKADLSREPVIKPRVHRRTPERTVTHYLENGLRLLIREKGSLVTSLSLMFPAGSKYDPPGKEGVAWLVNNMLFQGSQQFSHTEIKQRQEALGGRWNVSLDRDFAYVEISAQGDRLTPVLELLAGALNKPSFTAEELERYKGRLKSLLRQRTHDVNSVLVQRLYEKAFHNHPYANPVEGKPGSIDTISLADIHRFFDRHYSPKKAVLAVVGDVRLAEVRKASEQHLARLPRREAEEALPSPNELTPQFGLSTEDLDVPRARIAVGMRLGSGHAYPLALLINKHLQTQVGIDLMMKSGLSYNAFMTLHYTDAGSLSYMNCTGDPGDLDRIYENAKGYLEGTSQEFIKAGDWQELVDGMIGELTVKNAQSSHLAKNMAWHALADLGEDYYPDKLVSALKSTTRAQLNEYARKNIDLKKLITIQVKPAEKARVK